MVRRSNSSQGNKRVGENRRSTDVYAQKASIICVGAAALGQSVFDPYANKTVADLFGRVIIR